MENVRILFARPLKIGQCEFLGFFHLPSKFSMGFYLNAGLRPKYGRNCFSPMSMHKKINSTCITLVAFFDPKYFLVENRAPESIYFLTPNTQGCRRPDLCRDGCLIWCRDWYIVVCATFGLAHRVCVWRSDDGGRF